MSTSSLVLGESGTGKTTSLRNFAADEALLIQSIKKALPFPKGRDWKYLYVSDRVDNIKAAIKKTSKKVIIIDDFQYIIANEFMRRSAEKGYDKFTEMAKHAWELINACNDLPDDVRVYLLWHTQKDDQGMVKAKTIGKMLDEKIVIEGMFTIVLRTLAQDSKFYFSTVNNGSDTVKTPMGMFENNLIDNDLKCVDTAICNYYGLGEQR